MRAPRSPSTGITGTTTTPTTNIHTRKFRFGRGTGNGLDAETLPGRSVFVLLELARRSDILTRMSTLKTINDLRFPVGDFIRPANNTGDTRAVHIETLRLLPQRIKAAVSDLSVDQIDTPYREGGWTVRQVVHHVADSHANAYVRMKLALTEDWPIIKPYDEAAWAELADSHTMPVTVSLDLITALHARWVTLLESLSESDFQKGYEHPQSGRQNLALVLALYDWHSRHHVAHIANLRSRMGW